MFRTLASIIAAVFFVGVFITVGWWISSPVWPRLPAQGAPWTLSAAPEEAVDVTAPPEETSPEAAPAETIPVRPDPPEPLSLPSEPEPLMPLPGRTLAPPLPLPGGENRSAELIGRVQPEYPRLARQARMEGAVVIEARIAADGRVENVEVVQGNPVLGRAAADAVRQWRYEPALRNGVAVPVTLRVTVNFRLGG